MFDMNRIGKAIRTARIGKNMTQMDLADQMGVSYQAVSNWERGNSMPDIAKLETLSQVLGLSVSDLLGVENTETNAVTRILEKDDVGLTVGELSQIAPMLPPDQFREQTAKTAEKKKNWTVAELVDIAPYLDEAFLDELAEDVQVESLLVLQSLAPFLSEDTLDKLARRGPTDDFDGIAALAPFLDSSTLDALVRRCQNITADPAFLETLAPFLEEETLDYIVKRWGRELDPHRLVSLAPYLEAETLSKMAEAAAEIDTDTLISLAPFLEEETLDKLVSRLLDNDCDMTNVIPLFPFLEEDTLKKLLRHFLRKGDTARMKEAAKYL